MLLLHGALGSADQLAPLATALGGPTHRYDLHGHGASPLPGGPLTIERLADQLAGEIEALGLQGAPCFGYSLGGYVALWLAATRPGLVGPVTTLGTKFAWDAAVATREVGQLDPDRMQARAPAFAATLAARHTGAGWRALLAATAEMLRRLGDQPLLDGTALGRISVPVTVAVGDRDAMVSIEETLTAFRAIPGAQLAVLPGVGHPWERVPVSRIADLVREVSSGLDPRR